MNIKLYEEHKTDFYAWIKHNVTLLKQEKYSEVDMDHIREELEDMGGEHQGGISEPFSGSFGSFVKMEVSTFITGE